MKIIEKLRNKAEHIYDYRQPVIAFTGDSVTQGCFDVYTNADGKLDTRFDQTAAYSEKVKRILALLFPAANVTVVNAGLSGGTAARGLKRLERNVLSFQPDLTVVCYGLNDSNQREEGLEKYRDSLRGIFTELKAHGSEVIFLTPNLATDRVDCSIRDPEALAAAQRISGTVNDGWPDKYIAAAKAVCEEEGVPVCDCRALWKALRDGGVDITALLANKINHPCEKMLWMFAYELVKTMFEA
jgi:lysophospholipase L1-like esterase